MCEVTDRPPLGGPAAVVIDEKLAHHIPAPPVRGIKFCEPITVLVLADQRLLCKILGNLTWGRHRQAEPNELGICIPEEVVVLALRHAAAPTPPTRINHRPG